MVKKALGVCRQRVRDQHFLGAADGKNKQPLCHVIINEAVVFLILKLRHDLRVMDDRPHDELREKRDKKQVVQHVVVFRLSAEGIHEKGDELEREKGNTDRQYDVLQRYMGAGDKVHIFNKKIRVFVVAEKAYVCQYAGCQKQSALDSVRVALQPAQRVADNEIAHDASEEKREEIRASGGIKIKGCQYKPYFCQSRIPEMM